MTAATFVWIALGPFLRFSDGWLLVPSAGASIIALILGIRRTGTPWHCS